MGCLCCIDGMSNDYFLVAGLGGACCHQWDSLGYTLASVSADNVHSYRGNYDEEARSYPLSKMSVIDSYCADLLKRTRY